MANWITNCLTVKGKPDRLKEFIEFSKGHNDTWGDQALDADKYNGETVHFLNVKADFHEIPIFPDMVGKITFNYCTKSEPSNDIVFSMSLKFPDLLFDLKFFESSENMFSGEYIVMGGMVAYDIFRQND